MYFQKPLQQLARLAPGLALVPLTILSQPVAHAEIINLPAVPITVADCRAGYHWEVYGGITRCRPNLPPDNCENHGLWSYDQGGGSTWIPGVGPCYYQRPPPPPPPPSCYYSDSRYISIVGWASDFSSEPASVTVRYGWDSDMRVVATLAGRWDWPNFSELSPGGTMYSAMVPVMAALGFRPGGVESRWGAWNDGGPYASAWGGVVYQICPK